MTRALGPFGHVVFFDSFGGGLHRIFKGPDQFVRLAFAGEGLEALYHPGQVLILAQPRRDHLADRRMGGRTPPLVRTQKILGEAFARTQAVEASQDVDVRTDSVWSDERVG